MKCQNAKSPTAALIRWAVCADRGKQAKNILFYGLVGAMESAMASRGGHRDVSSHGTCPMSCPMAACVRTRQLVCAADSAFMCIKMLFRDDRRSFGAQTTAVDCTEKREGALEPGGKPGRGPRQPKADSTHQRENLEKLKTRHCVVFLWVA